MVKVFSFCIYGSLKKYCEGLARNIAIIQRCFPDYEIWIYGGSDVPRHYIDTYTSYNNVKYIYVNITGPSLRCFRYFPIDDINVDICFMRDADSRIGERDIWCINKFIESDYKFHTIRDHFCHQTRIMEGLFGIKQSTTTTDTKYNIKQQYNEWFKQHQNLADQDNIDSHFITSLNIQSSDLMIHTNIAIHEDEDEINIYSIDVPRTSIHDFMGNVIDIDDNNNDVPQFNYCQFLTVEYIQTIRSTNLLIRIGKDLCDERFITLYSSFDRYVILTMVYDANFAAGNYDECRTILGYFGFTHVDDDIIARSNELIVQLKRRDNIQIIGTTKWDTAANITSDIIICYGNYCNDITNLPITNVVYRNVIYYDTIIHDLFYADECWQPIDQIYVINMVNRRDRYIDILTEFARMDMPLNKVTHIKGYKNAITDNNLLNSYLGATDSHILASKDMINNAYKYCLIFEDDFTFNMNYRELKDGFKMFFERNYKFDVCFLGASKYHEIVKYDDLVSISRQQCTTTSGYMLCSESVQKISDCFIEGYNHMFETGDYVTYVCDRYWKKLQGDDKFLIFNKKFGYQRIAHSSIVDGIICTFD